MITKNLTVDLTSLIRESLLLALSLAFIKLIRFGDAIISLHLTRAKIQTNNPIIDISDMYSTYLNVLDTSKTL